MPQVVKNIILNGRELTLSPCAAIRIRRRVIAMVPNIFSTKPMMMNDILSGTNFLAGAAIFALQKYGIYAADYQFPKFGTNATAESFYVYIDSMIANLNRYGIKYIGIQPISHEKISIELAVMNYVSNERILKLNDRDMPVHIIHELVVLLSYISEIGRLISLYFAGTVSGDVDPVYIFKNHLRDAFCSM